MPVEMVPTTLTDVRGSILIVGGVFAWEGDLGLFKVEKASRAPACVCPPLPVSARIVVTGIFKPLLP